MADVKIRIITTQDGDTYVQETAEGLTGIGKAGEQAAEGLDKTTQSSKSFIGSATEAWSTIQAWNASFNAAGGMIDSTLRGGEAVQHATQALDQLSRGQAPAYITAMTVSTHGLVGTMDLAHYAALGLSTGIASSATEMAKIAGIGAGLGEIFMNDATQGIAAFDNALMHVGQTRPLATLGFDITAVKDRFSELTKLGMDKAEAWKQTLLELAPTFADTGNAWDKFMVRAGNSMDDLKGRAATGFNGISDAIDLLSSKKVTVDVVFNAVKNEDFSWIVKLVGDSGFVGPAGIANGGTVTRMGTRPTGGGPATLSGGFNTGLGGDQGFGPDGTYYTGMMSSSGGGGGGGAPTSIRGMQFNGGLGSDQSPFTSSEASARGNARGGYNVQPGYEPQSDRLALAADSAKRAQVSADALANRMAASAASAGQMDGYMQNVYNSAQKTANTSLAQAFGTTSGGIGGEIGGGLSQDAAAQRQKLVKGGASQSALASFDDQTKQAMDQYRIATGQATPESVKFSDALSAVDKAAQSGRISVAQATKDYLSLAQAAKEGHTNIGEINALMWGQDTAHMGGQAGVGARNRSQSLDRASGVDPFKPIQDGADLTVKKAGEVGTTATAQVAVVSAAGKGMAAGLEPVIAQLRTIISMQSQVTGVGGQGPSRP